jgi:AcrR family transcriptional regulator
MATSGGSEAGSETGSGTPADFRDRSARGEARAAILAATIKVLETSGEASVRLASIAEDAGVAIGLIGYHFGGREGLIQTAQAERYSGRSFIDLAALDKGLAEAKSPTEFLDMMTAFTLQAMVEVASEGSRLRRVALLGSAFGRPELLRYYGAVQSVLNDEYEQVVRRGQEAGLLRSDLDPRAIAVFGQAYAFGSVLGDIDPKGPDAEVMTQVIRAALSGLLASADPA